MKSIMDFLRRDAIEPVDKTEEEITEAMARASKCLSMPEFKDYRTKFEAAEAGIIDELIVLSVNFDGDTGKFGAKCLTKLTRLRDLRALLTAVNNDKGK
jgi:hypothetical protein